MDNQVNNPVISWFPGHMHKAQKTLQRFLPALDLLIEVRDARLPEGSANPWLKAACGALTQIVVLNKCDLAHAQINMAWKTHFSKAGIPVVLLEAKHKRGVAALKQILKECLDRNRAAYGQRRFQAPPLKAVVVGMPNVGKSTLINRLVGKRSAFTAPEPGATRSVNWVALEAALWLMDSPGLMLPAVRSSEIGHMLGWIGSLPEARLGAQNLATSLLDYLSDRAQQALHKRYGDLPLKVPGEAVLGHICAHKKWLLKGGKPDLERAAIDLLRAFRSGQLGRHTLQLPTPSRRCSSNAC